MSAVLRTAISFNVALLGSPNFKLIFLTAVLLMLVERGATIKCFKCQVTPQLLKNENRTLNSLLCSKFDESEDYEVDCPYSTMCVKNILKYYLQNGGAVDTVTRGCASQKYTDQVFRQGNWRAEYKVEEPYDEGCKEFKENSLSASGTTYCYCRGNLCNSAIKHDSTKCLYTETKAVIFFSVLRWLCTRYEIFLAT